MNLPISELLTTLFSGVILVWLLDLLARVIFQRDGVSFAQRLLPNAGWLDLFEEPWLRVVDERGQAAKCSIHARAQSAGDPALQGNKDSPAEQGNKEDSPAGQGNKESPGQHHTFFTRPPGELRICLNERVELRFGAHELGPEQSWILTFPDQFVVRSERSFKVRGEYKHEHREPRVSAQELKVCVGHRKIRPLAHIDEHRAVGCEIVHGPSGKLSLTPIPPHIKTAEPHRRAPVEPRTISAWAAMVGALALIYLGGVLVTGVSNWFYDSPGVHHTLLGAMWGREDDLRASVYHARFSSDYHAAGITNDAPSTACKALLDTSWVGLASRRWWTCNSESVDPECVPWHDYCQKFGEREYYEAKNVAMGLPGTGAQLVAIQDRIEVARALGFLGQLGVLVCVAAAALALAEHAKLKGLCGRGEATLCALGIAVLHLALVLLIVFQSSWEPWKHIVALVAGAALPLVIVGLASFVAKLDPAPTPCHWKGRRVVSYLALFVCLLFAADLTWATQEKEFNKLAYGAYLTHRNLGVSSEPRGLAWFAHTFSAPVASFEPSGVAWAPNGDVHVVSDDDEFLTLHRYRFNGERLLSRGILQYPTQVAKVEALSAEGQCLWIAESGSYSPKKYARLWRRCMYADFPETFGLEPALVDIRNELDVDWVKVEGLAVQGAEVYLGVRSGGASYKAFEHIPAVFRAKIEGSNVGKAELLLRLPSSVVGDQGTEVLGISALTWAPFAMRRDLFVLLTQEVGPDRRGLLTRLIRIENGCGIAPCAADDLVMWTYRKTWPAKAEGITIRDGVALLVFDSDGLKAEAIGGFPLARNEDYYLVLPDVTAAWAWERWTP